MPNSSTFLPVWVVAPIGFLVLMVLAAHMLALRATVTDPRRRRIRTASNGLMMVVVPILCYGLCGATTARSREFILVWLLVAVLIMLVILLALADMMHSMQLHRAQLREVRKSLARNPLAPNPPRELRPPGPDANG